MKTNIYARLSTRIYENNYKLYRLKLEYIKTDVN